MRLLTILGSKGGIGKSTLASNLLVAAQLDDVAAAGVDLDSQGSFAGWAAKRLEAGARPSARVITGGLLAWRDALEDAAEGVDLVVADTPPGLPDQEHVRASQRLATESGLVLIPALAKGPTLEKIAEIGEVLRDLGAPVVFVLNMIDRRLRAARAARSYLVRYGEVCEVEIPDREHVHQAMHEGLTVTEDKRLAGSGAMRDLWAFAADRLGLA